MADTRPVTSKPRGTCRFYNTPNGCLAGRTCKFLHGDAKLTSYDQAKTCRFYKAGFCKRGAECWFVHERSTPVPQQESASDDGSEEDMCCICYEKPTTYGLLCGCSHIFCLTCIKEWRVQQDKSVDVINSGVTKKCPLCREGSQFITPSSHFYPQDDPQKAVVIEKYKMSMARVPCKYFEQSRKQYCPFGKNCFYQHLNSDGTPYVFKRGVAHQIRDKRYRQLRRQLHSEGSSSSTSYATPIHHINDYEAIIASLRSLALSVREASDRTAIDAAALLNSGNEEQADAWPPEGSLADTEAALSTLTDDIIANLLAIPIGPATFAPATSSVNAQSTPRPEAPALTQIEESVEPVASTSTLTVPTDDLIASILVDRSSQSTPLGHVSSVPQPVTQRPSSALNAPTRFSTSIPGRTPSPLDDGVEIVTTIPWSRNREATTARNTNEPVAPEHREPSIVNEPASSGPVDQTPFPSIAHTSPPASADSIESSTTVAPAIFNDACAAPLVHGSDPPFMTDGRGRVVWSSSTAVARSRRSRTTTAVPATSVTGGTVLPAAREKPRGEAHGQTNSPAIRSASLARREMEGHGHSV